MIHLDGTRRLSALSREFRASETQITHLFSVLHDRCIIEPMAVRESINANDYARVLNFLGDYIPAQELTSHFQKIRSTRVAIFGCGAVGSWIAIQLAHSGIRDFVIVDHDIVEASNLNRSLFQDTDVGRPKVEALASALIRVCPDAAVAPILRHVSEPKTAAEVFSQTRPEILVNCADTPSVDTTSEWVNDFCQQHQIPYVIAGGYNLHLSLVGLTVIPGQSACFNCAKLTLDELQDDSLQGVRRLWRPKRNLGSLAPVTGITSALAALEVLRLAALTRRLVPAMLNRRGEFNFLTNELSFVSLPPRAECGCVPDAAGPP